MSIGTRTDATDMDCTDFLERYSDYDDSLLSQRELSEFRAHLRACPACARYDHVLRKGRMLARQIPAPEPDREFGARLRHRLGGRRRSGVVLPPFAAAAMAAVTILLVATSALPLLERVSGPTAGSADGAGRREAVTTRASDRWLRGSGSPTGLVVPVALEGRSVVLPATSPRVPRAWAAERVDRRRVASYSPLVTGPPAYRATRTYPLGSMTSTRRTLD